MSDNTVVHSEGVGILGLMFILFLGLKLTGHITWSWWWITAPIWGGIGLVFVVLLLIFLVVAIAACFQ